MAKYTVELGKIIESNFDIGLKDYPIYNEEHRKELNEKIIDHYYFREIGLETPELFKRFLNRKMNEIMPYYNQLYKSEDLKFNPLYNIELTETYEHTSNIKGKTDSTSKQTGTSKNDTTTNDNGFNYTVENDTPSTPLTDELLKNGVYASRGSTNKGEATNSRKETGEMDQDSTNNINTDQETTDQYTKKTEGSSAGLSFSKAIDQWRKIMINIDMQIIEELEPLFMGLW